MCDFQHTCTFLEAPVKGISGGNVSDDSALLPGSVFSLVPLETRALIRNLHTCSQDQKLFPLRLTGEGHQKSKIACDKQPLQKRLH